MFGYSRNSGINWFRNYGDALHKYNSTTDIRGRTVEPKRPLGRRNAVDTYSIVKRDDDAIECVFYKTPVVTFFPNGEIHVRDYRYATTSTASFIGEVLGVRARLFNGSIAVRIMNDEFRLPVGGDGVLILKRDEFEELRAINPMRDAVHSVSRKKANNVRASYEEFATYALAVCKLKAWEFGEEDYKSRFGEDKNNNFPYGLTKMPVDLTRYNYEEFVNGAKKFFELIEDKSDQRHDSYYEAILMLARSYGNFRYREGGYRFNQVQLKRGLNDLILGKHRDEVFETKECGMGTLRKDAYAKYFCSGWKKYHDGIAK